MTIIDQIKEASNILGYVRTKKVIEIIETKPKRKSGNKGYRAIMHNGEILCAGPKSKTDTALDFASIAMPWMCESLLEEYISYSEYKKLKKEGVPCL